MTMRAAFSVGASLRPSATVSSAECVMCSWGFIAERRAILAGDLAALARAQPQAVSPLVFGGSPLLQQGGAGLQSSGKALNFMNGLQPRDFSIPALKRMIEVKPFPER
jgi:hypothetical protein